MATRKRATKEPAVAEAEEQRPAEEAEAAPKPATAAAKRSKARPSAAKADAGSSAAAAQSDGASEVEAGGHGGEGAVFTGAKIGLEVHEAAPAPKPIAAPVGEGSTDRQWYVIHAYSGHEDKVRDNLLKRVENLEMQSKIFSVLVPKEEEIEIKDGQRRHVQKRIFPGYVLVEMVMDDEAWYVVRNTPGVTSFVGSGNQPVPLQESEVRAILKQIRAEAPKVRVEFARGQSVRVIDGPFTDFTGKIEEMNTEKGKIKVLVNMFGRETPVELDLLQVEKA